jgi:hypothetical protein
MKVTTRPSNQTYDEWSDAPTAARPYVPDLAWSAEPPECAAVPTAERARPWFVRSGALTFVGAGLVLAAAVGIFGALHGAQSNPVGTTSHSAPASVPMPAAAPVRAPAPTNPAPTTSNQTKSATMVRPVTASHRSSSATLQQSPPQHTAPCPSGHHPNDQQWQPNNKTVSTPPTWNGNDYFYWFTHRRDHTGSHWTGDRDRDNPSNDQSSDNGWSN